MHYFMRDEQNKIKKKKYLYVFLSRYNRIINGVETEYGDVSEIKPFFFSYFLKIFFFFYFFLAATRSFYTENALRLHALYIKKKKN